MSVPLTTELPVVPLELVARFGGPMPAGVTISRSGRLFVTFPKSGDEVTATMTELRDGHCEPYPDRRWNSPTADNDPDALGSARSVVVDPADRLWILDSGSATGQPKRPGAPRLLRVDLETDTVRQTIVLPPDVALPTSHLSDMRFDLRRGEAGMAFITDSSDRGPNAIIVVDLATGTAWRRLHEHASTKAEPPRSFRPLVEGRPLAERPLRGPPQPVTTGARGIAISADGNRLYYCPLASRRLYSLSVDALVDVALDDADVAGTVVDEGDKGTGAAGLESDHLGRIYVTAYEHDAILRRGEDGDYQTVAHDPRLLWPDTLSVSADGYLYITATQWHRQARYQFGQDLRRKPYALFRIPIYAEPVALV